MQQRLTHRGLTQGAFYRKKQSCHSADYVETFLLGDPLVTEKMHEMNETS
jgi:hypothetical protein